MDSGKRRWESFHPSIRIYGYEENFNVSKTSAAFDSSRGPVDSFDTFLGSLVNSFGAAAILPSLAFCRNAKISLGKVLTRTAVSCILVS